MDDTSESPRPFVRVRVANACDVCKARKVKCDGVSPCGYCTRHRRPQHCHYSPQRRRGLRAPARKSRSTPAGLSKNVPPTPAPRRGGGGGRDELDDCGSESPASAEEHDEAEVPRDARLLCDAQGKLIFIGDCAPLSFFQTVRRFVTSRVDANAFAPQTSRYSMLENVHPKASTPSGPDARPPLVDAAGLEGVVASYLAVTAGLIDIFDNARLLDDLSLWAAAGCSEGLGIDDLGSAVKYLVLAIGCQKTDERLSQAYFDFARDRALANLGGNLSAGIVQAFLLVTLYMLGASQINGAFLFFGIAGRAAYSVGIHRTEVNARFGPDARCQRDRLWKSLRVVDLFLSTSMGRPPATSDVDCTVPYRAVDDATGDEAFDLVNASVQILLITEAVVVEVYSRRKVSLRLTEGISRELRNWSARWLRRLKNTLAGASARDPDPAALNGACQILSSYYYAVILVSRPFLMYELHRRLSDDASSSPLVVSGKSKFADACIDAASLMVDSTNDLIGRGLMIRPAPVVVSWLFASSLVLGLGILGGFGRITEKYCRLSIAALEYFAESDGHAMQYSLIAKSLLATALEYLEKREAEERLQRTESSSQIFGLVPREDNVENPSQNTQQPTNRQTTSPPVREVVPTSAESIQSRVAYSWASLPRFGLDVDSSFLGLSDDALPGTPDISLMSGSFGDADQSLGALNLFPLLDVDGHIDLTHYL